MPECAIVSCKNTNKLYSLPESPALRAAWLEKINRLNYVPTSNTRVCESHFDSNAFIPDEENKAKQSEKSITSLNRHVCVKMVHCPLLRN